MRLAPSTATIVLSRTRPAGWVSAGIGTAWSPSRSPSGGLRVMKTVEGGPQDGFDVGAVAVNGGDRDDQVEDLLDRQVVADLTAAYGRLQQRLPGGQAAGPALAEDAPVLVGVREQLGNDLPLAGHELEEPPQPRRQRRAGRRAEGLAGGRADGVDLVQVERLEQLPAGGVVAGEVRLSR